VSPSEENISEQGAVVSASPSSPISTNSLAPTSWKNLRLHGKDVFGRGRSHRGSSPRTQSSQPFGLGGSSFGENWARCECPRGRHTTTREFEVSLKGLGASAKDIDALRRIRALITSKVVAAQQEQEARSSSSQP
jgi:hypothetical protein